MVKHFYKEVARLPKISDHEMGIVMENLSEQQNDGFDTISALKELYIYVTKYRDQVCVTFDDSTGVIFTKSLFLNFSDSRRPRQ